MVLSDIMVRFTPGSDFPAGCTVGSESDSSCSSGWPSLSQLTCMPVTGPLRCSQICTASMRRDEWKAWHSWEQRDVQELHQTGGESELRCCSFWSRMTHLFHKDGYSHCDVNHWFIHYEDSILVFLLLISISGLSGWQNEVLSYELPFGSRSRTNPSLWKAFCIFIRSYKIPSLDWSCVPVQVVVTHFEFFGFWLEDK